MRTEVAFYELVGAGTEWPSPGCSPEASSGGSSTATTS